MKPSLPRITVALSRVLTHACLLLALASSAVLAADPAPPPTATPAETALEQARAALRGRQFEQAVRELDAWLTANSAIAGADEALYLKALALCSAKKYAEATGAAGQVLDKFPKSPWYQKALFLKARALAEQKQFKDAEAIYEAEALRLLSDPRKQEIARRVLDFADKLATPPAPNDPAAPPANYPKACNLYAKVLEMEIGRGLRDEVMFKRARALQQGAGPARRQEQSQAIQAYQAYLTEFDPAWTGAGHADSAGRKDVQENPPPAGKNRLAARFHLAECLLQSANAWQARLETEDLIKLLGKEKPEAADAAFRADVAWLLALANGFGAPCSAATVEPAVKTAREFLAAFPQDRRAARAAFLIGEAYRSAGRNDQAIAAYQDFLAGKGFALPEGKAASERDKETGKSPAELKGDQEMIALYTIADIQAAQGKHTEAIATWQQYIAKYPNGPQWAAAQQAMINAAFQIGQRAIADRKYDGARRLLDQFLQKNPLDSRAPQVLYLFGQMQAAQAQELEKNKGARADIEAAYRRALDEWVKLVSKYPGTEESSQALYQIGMIWEEKLGDLEKALDAYRRLNWGSCAAAAQGRLTTMTGKQLTLTTERTFRTDEPAKVKLRTRNIKKVTVRQYALDLEAYFRKTHAMDDADALDIALIEPDRTWEVEVKEYAKYKPIEQELEIPFAAGKPGVCIVNISEDDWEATALVIRSDLDMIVKSSRREALAFVEDMRRKQPAEKVKVLFSDGKTVVATGDTGKDGVFRKALSELKEAGTVRAFASLDGNVSCFNLDLSGLGLGTGLSAKGYIYTDRPAYRPGQQVNIRGILREVKNGAYASPAGATVVVSVADAKGRLLREEPVRLSDFGTFATGLKLPAAAALGQYTITARQVVKEQTVLACTGAFTVQKFNLEKMKLALSVPRQVWFRGEIIEAELLAEYYWGEPVVGKAVRYTLPDGRSFTGKTDAKGHLAFAFDTSSMSPGRPLRFQATIEGENVALTETLTLATLGFSLSLKPSQDLVLAGEPFDVNVKSLGADGEPLSADVTLAILRIEEPKSDPVLDAVSWLARPEPRAAEVTVREFKLKTDPKTGEARQALALDKGGRYLLRASGPDRFGQIVTGETGVTISDDTDATKLRFFADSATLKVGSTAKVRLHSRMTPGLVLLTHEGEEVLQYQVLEIKPGYNDLEVKVGHEHFPNFQIAAAGMDGRSLRTAAKAFTVERELKVALRPLKDAWLPGEDAQVELTVTDQLGQPVVAELSLALVDEAVFALFPDATPKILSFFQAEARRFADFRVGSTCSLTYAGVTRPVLKEILDEKERLARAEAEAVRRREVAADMETRLGWDGNGKDEKLAQTTGGKRARRAPARLVDGALSINGPAEHAARTAQLEEAQSEQVLAEGKLKAGEGNDSGLESGAAAALPRREMPGAGGWLPAIVTDKTGKAVVTLPMPETTTRWRLTSRGCSVETLVGEATASTLTRKDFFVEMKAPGQVQEGDALRVVARVHNLSKYKGPVELRLRFTDPAAPGKPLVEKTQQVQVEADGGAEIAFEAVDIPAVWQLGLELSATAGEHKDALALDLPVKPWGLDYAAQAGGVARADATAVLELPGDIEYSRRWLTVAVGPNLARTVLDLALEPGGFVPLPSAAERNLPLDQAGWFLPPVWGVCAGSDLLGAVAGLEYARRLNAPEPDRQRFVERVRALVSGLVVSQREDGGWAWQGQVANSDWAATARAYWALVRARNAGIPVNADTVNKAQTFLNNAFQGLGVTDNDAKALVLHALSVNDAADFANCNRLYRERNSLGNAALAYAALSFLNLKRPEIAGEILDVLETRGVDVGPKDRPRLCWEAKSNHPWINDPVETTALVLMAFSGARPQSPKAQAAVEYLLNQRGCFGFSPAKAGGPAVAALAAYFADGKLAATDARIVVRIDGKDVATVEAKGPQSWRTIAVPPELIKAGRNLVEFKMEGRGEFAYAATLTGFSPQLRDPKSFTYPYVQNRYYYHAPLEYRGRAIGAGSTSPVSNLESGGRIGVRIDFYESQYPGYLVVEEPIPAGTMLVDGSLTGNFSYSEVVPGMIRLYYLPNQNINDVNYQLVGYAPGVYRALPTVMRDAMNPGRMRLGPVSKLTILAPGEKSPDPYQMNNGELFALGQAYFDDGLYGQAVEHLTELFKRDRTANERDLARMLLWIHTTPEFYNAKRIVEMFEILRERYPQLEIPFDRILTVGKAYRDIGEFERAWIVFRATIGASFVSDSNVSAVLQDEGQFLASVDFQEGLWREYPDSAEVTAAYFALSQVLYQKAPTAHLLPKEGNRVPEKTDLLDRTARMLLTFLTLYPDNPLADEAAFSLANALLDLRNYPAVVRLSTLFKERFAAGAMASSFQYMAALGYFWQRDYAAALAAAKVVADGESKDRDFARYILGQIHHAKKEPGEAIRWYGMVKAQYPDAAEAIAYFEAKRVGLDEVSVFKPGEPVKLKLRYRNIRSAALQVYRVDLMKLYLREKNLSSMTAVKLAGIKPEMELDLPLGDGRDYVDKEKEALLGLKDEGAYLVICRGDDLFASGLVLITPLKIEVQEDVASGRTRANVMDAVKGGYRDGVHVKAIGSADKEFRSGETDLRGIFVADNLRGKATIIAREGKARYAFYRGTQWLGAPLEAPPPEKPAAQPAQQLDYQMNLRNSNEMLQRKNIEVFEKGRRSQQRGVQVQQAF